MKQLLRLNALVCIQREIGWIFNHTGSGHFNHFDQIFIKNLWGYLRVCPGFPVSFRRVYTVFLCSKISVKTLLNNFYEDFMTCRLTLNLLTNEILLNVPLNLLNGKLSKDIIKTTRYDQVFEVQSILTLLIFSGVALFCANMSSSKL